MSFNLITCSRHCSVHAADVYLQIRPCPSITIEIADQHPVKVYRSLWAGPPFGGSQGGAQRRRMLWTSCA